MHKEIGIIGLGNMGVNVANRLNDNGYSLILYNRTKDKYAPFKGKQNAYLSKDLQDFVKRLKEPGNNAVIWMMLPGGDVTNGMIDELSSMLKKEDVVIDVSNALYVDSIANYDKMKKKGISYLDVGCAGGPGDVLKGVALMVGGDKAAYEKTKEIFRIVSGNGVYGYVGGSGAGQITKLVHNGIFYGIFPVYSEGVELLLKMKDDAKGEFNVKEALRLLKASPPITTDIMDAIADSVGKGELPENPPQMKVSETVSWEAKRASELGVSFSITKAILSGYSTMSEGSRKVYIAAKKIVTGH